MHCNTSNLPLKYSSSLICRQTSSLRNTQLHVTDMSEIKQNAHGRMAELCIYIPLHHNGSEEHQHIDISTNGYALTFLRHMRCIDELAIITCSTEQLLKCMNDKKLIFSSWSTDCQQKPSILTAKHDWASSIAQVIEIHYICSVLKPASRDSVYCWDMTWYQLCKHCNATYNTQSTSILRFVANLCRTMIFHGRHDQHVVTPRTIILKAGTKNKKENRFAHRKRN